MRHAESDAWLALGLAFYLSVLPLTRQLVSAHAPGWRQLSCRWVAWQPRQWLCISPLHLSPLCSATITCCLVQPDLCCPAPRAATRPQASLSGSLWSKALLGHRAQRIEMLLLHEFYDKKFLLPDKLNNKVGGWAGRQRWVVDGQGSPGPRSCCLHFCCHL